MSIDIATKATEKCYLNYSGAILLPEIIFQSPIQHFLRSEARKIKDNH
jgi:hypothetical protein